MKLFSLVASTSCITFGSCMFYAPIKMGYGGVAGMMHGVGGYGNMMGIGLGELLQLITFLVVFKKIISQLGGSHGNIGGSHRKWGSYYKGGKEQLSSTTQTQPTTTTTQSTTTTTQPTITTTKLN